MFLFVVLDTNVLVSALLSKNEDSATVQVLNTVLKGTLRPLFSQKTIEEYKEVLIRPKFGFDKELVRFVINYIEKTGLLIEPEPTELDFFDKDDAPFYELYKSKGDCCFLVTGNLRHFPQEPGILSPSELIRSLSVK